MKFKNDHQFNRLIVYVILDIAVILLFAFKTINFYIFAFGFVVFTYLLAVAIYFYSKSKLIIDEYIEAKYPTKSTYYFSKISTTRIELKDVKSINKQFLSSRGDVVLVIKYKETSLILKNMFSDRQMDKILAYCTNMRIIKK